MLPHAGVTQNENPYYLLSITSISVYKIWGQLNDHLEKSYFRLTFSYNNSKPNFRLFKNINKERNPKITRRKSGEH